VAKRLLIRDFLMIRLSNSTTINQSPAFVWSLQIDQILGYVIYKVFYELVQLQNSPTRTGREFV